MFKLNSPIIRCMDIPEREITLAENGSICLHSHKGPELQITGDIEDNSKIIFSSPEPKAPGDLIV